MIAAHDARYHVKCLVSVYNKIRGKDSWARSKAFVNHAVALAELVTYIYRGSPQDALVAPVFVIADLAALYLTRMEQLGTIVTRCVHLTNLKNLMLSYFPALEEHKQDRDCYLLSTRIFVQHVSRQLTMAQLISPGLSTWSDETRWRQRQPLGVGLTQTVQYHWTIQHHHIAAPDLQLQCRRESITDPIKHSHHQEATIPAPLRLFMHTKTRNQDLVDILFQLDMSVSNDQVPSISRSQLALMTRSAVTFRKNMQFVSLSWKVVYSQQGQWTHSSQSELDKWAGLV